LNQAPIAGLSVCDHADQTNCATTNNMGQATLTLPDTDVTVDYSGAGYRTHLLSLRQGAGSGSVVTLAISNANLPTLLALVGATDDMTKGHIGGRVNNVVGATVSLVPASGGGPFYSATNGLPNPSLTSTTSAGTFFYTNVNPGTPDLGAMATGLTCATQLGVIGAMPNQADILVEAGAITIVSNFVCQ
ncbi:MAG: hypothetical protein KC731_35350, partial [Myxococcales bacterium]|nr:hypothetical protein [Myxococcales bacterium]